MVEAVEAGANVTLHRTDADGLTVYEPVDAPSPVVGVLGPNTYALGEPAAVTDAAAVASGEADPATGSLRERFRGTRAGYVTLVYPFPHAAVPDLPEGVLRAFAHARTVTGVYYSNESANGTRLGAEFGIHTNDSDAAQTIEASLGLALPLFAANTDDPVLSQAARNVSVTQSGPSVFLGYEARMDRVRALLKRLDE